MEIYKDFLQCSSYFMEIQMNLEKMLAGSKEVQGILEKFLVSEVEVFFKRIETDVKEFRYADEYEKITSPAEMQENAECIIEDISLGFEHEMGRLVYQTTVRLLKAQMPRLKKIEATAKATMRAKRKAEKGKCPTCGSLTTIKRK